MLRVLIVDDHQLARDSLGVFIEQQEGVTVVGKAGDGIEAVALAGSLKPDVVVMDINMPRMDGIEATRQILNTMPYVRVIGFSLRDTEHDRAAMMRAGAVDHVSKSEPMRLLAALRSGTA